MPRINRFVSPRRIAANRTNALKSTGPRTPEGKRRVALNRFKNGVEAASETLFRRALTVRGEDAEEFLRLREGLVQAWQPANQMEAMLVSELATLYWKKRRFERAQLYSDLSAARERECAREEREIFGSLHEVPPNESLLPLYGYRNINECPAKYREADKLFNQLLGWAEKRAWPDDLDPTFLSLYAEKPTILGNQIMEICRRLSQADAGAASDTDRTQLQRLIDEERQQMARESDYMKNRAREQDREYAPGSPKPLSDQWSLMLKQDASLDRQIHAKIRILLRMKNARAAAPRSVGKK